MRVPLYLLLLAACLGLIQCNTWEKDEPSRIVDCTRYTPTTDTVNGTYLIDTVMSDGKLQTDFVRNVTFAGNDTFEIINRYLTDCDFYIRDFYIKNGFFPYPRENYINLHLDPYNYDVFTTLVGGTLTNPVIIANELDTIFLFKGCLISGSGNQSFRAQVKVIKKSENNLLIVKLYLDKNNFIVFRQV